MKDKKYLVGSILLVIILVVTLLSRYYTSTTYTKNMYYMDTYITIKVSTNKSKDKVDKIFNKIDNLYKDYHNLTNPYDENSTLYYINHNTSNEEDLTIDSRLYDLLKLGIDYYKETNGLLNINMGNIISLWKSYRDKGEGIPSKEEIDSNKDHNIEDIVLLNNNKIKNTHPHIDLGAIAKGYVTELASNTLKEEGITSFIINAGGNVVVGKNNKKKAYTVGIQSPVKPSDIYTKVNVNNKAVVTSGGYERFYEYEGVKYHHIIDPTTLYPASNMQSITVITSSSSLADIMSTYLFLLDTDKAIEYVNNHDDLECIIYTNDGKTLKSKGIDKYE